MRRVVIAGASLAGVSAAEALREAGFGGQITLLGDEPHPPYERPPLSKEALSGDKPDPRPLRPDGWYSGNGIELRLDVAATALDTVNRRVLLADGGEVCYDGLILATGTRPAPLPETLAAPGVRTLRTIEDATALRSALTEMTNADVLVVGAGFIGLEVAAAARGAGARVTIVEVAPSPLARALGDQVGEWLAAWHRDGGMDVRCGQSVRQIAVGKGGGYQITLRDQTTIRADVVVAAIGVVPAIGWLRGSGVATGDGVLCDSACRTSVPGIVAAGDLARWYNPLFDEDMRIEHWTNAIEQGRAAAHTLLRQPAVYAPVPYFWSDTSGMRIRFAGRANAAAEVRVEDRGGRSMVALFKRDGLIRGVLTVNAVRDLPLRRQQILDACRWEDVVLFRASLIPG